MKRNYWTCFLLILAGIVLGGFLGSLFPGTFLDFGQTFGLSSPVVLDLGIICLTFGLTIKITVASLIGIFIALIVNHFL